MKTFSKAMVIEDNQMDSFVLKWHIDKNGVAERVLICSDGQEALNYLKGLAVDAIAFPELLFLDINMPKMSGFEFLDQFSLFDQTIIEKTKIIMITSSDNEEDRNRAEHYPNIVGYVIKPIETEAFQKMMEMIGY